MFCQCAACVSVCIMHTGMNEMALKIPTGYFTFPQVLVLLVNFVTDFVCAQGPNNELCLEKLFQTNVRPQQNLFV